jgi:hypothetical protein
MILNIDSEPKTNPRDCHVHMSLPLDLWFISPQVFMEIKRTIQCNFSLYPEDFAMRFAVERECMCLAVEL